MHVKTRRDISRQLGRLIVDERRSTPLIGEVVPNFGLAGDGCRPSHVGTDRTEA
ncbi:MAG: hypothetical protein ACE5NG_10335 [bacterium]